MWIYETQSLQIVEANNAAIDWYGYTRKDFLNKTITQLRLSIGDAALHEMINNTSESSLHLKNCHYSTKDGVSHFVDINSYPVEFKGMQCRLMQTAINEHSHLAGMLADSQQKFSYLLHHTPIGFCQLDNCWKITEWNTAAEHLIGYRAADVNCRVLWKVLPELLHTDFYSNCMEAVESQIKQEFTMYYWPLQHWLSVSLYPGDTGLIIQLRDITRKKMFEEALLYKLQQLKQLSFFNSHFIRKPVASLIGITQLVVDEVTDATEIKQIAGYIKECSTELDEMLKRMNRMLRSGEGTNLVNNLSYFDFRHLILNTVERAKSRYPESEINVFVTEQIAYYGNEKALQSALMCLIDNAAKFSGGCTPVNIRADVIKGNIVISVQDYGAGMSHKQLYAFFETYNRDKVTESIGLGLLNVFNIIKKHQGNFWIESTLQVGTVFTVCLPLSNIPAYHLQGCTAFESFQQPQLEIKYCSEQKYLHTRWLGFHNAQSVKAYCSQILAAVLQSGAKKIMIDKSGSMGVWEGAVKWILYEWHTKLAGAGVSCIAAVYSPCTFSNFSASRIVEQNKSCICVQMFNTSAAALDWLNQ